jgi:CheY-like chemotaxis protein
MSKTILIVDDQSFIRSVLKRKLESVSDVELVEAEDGDDAIAKAMELKPNLIFLDIMMPKIDGLTILQELKSQEDTKNIPIVIVSSYADEGKQAKAKELGVEQFVDKADLQGVDFVELVNTYLA